MVLIKMVPSLHIYPQTTAFQAGHSLFVSLFEISHMNIFHMQISQIMVYSGSGMATEIYAIFKIIIGVSHRSLG